MDDDLWIFGFMMLGILFAVVMLVLVVTHCELAEYFVWADAGCTFLRSPLDPADYKLYWDTISA